VNATIQDLIDAHVRSVQFVNRQGPPEAARPVDPTALRGVLQRQLDVFRRCGYRASELTLLPEGSDWWGAQIVPFSVLKGANKKNKPGTSK
jgi:hypothetical protein